MSQYDDDADRMVGERCDLCGEVFVDCDCEEGDFAGTPLNPLCDVCGRVTCPGDCDDQWPEEHGGES
jgi:hypothetical protein